MQIKCNICVLLLVCLALAGCNLPAEATEAVPTLPATATPFQPILGAQSPGGVTLEEGETEGAAAANWWFSPALPAGYAEAFSLPAGGQVVADEADAHLIVSANNGEALSEWVYAVVAPYPTLTDDVSWE